MNLDILQAGRHRRTLLHLALILLGAVFPYLNTFDVPFFFDDHNNIVDNSVIHDIHRFLGGAGLHYNPRRFIGYLTLALNSHFGALNVAGYHAVNLAVHTLAALLVYALVRVTFKTPLLRGSILLDKGPPVALLVALLFAVHPIQTQAVTYIVQRFTSLAALFYLLAMVLYAWGRMRGPGDQGLGTGDRGSVKPLRPITGPQSPVPSPQPLFTIVLFAGSLVSAVLAMMTKETALTLPFAVLLYEVTFFRAAWRRRLAWLLPPLAILALVAVGLLGSVISLGQALSSIDLLPRDSILISRLDYLFTQFRVLVTYLRLLFFPVGQNLDHDYPIYHSFFTPPVFLSFLLLLGLLALAVGIYWKTGNREQGTGIGGRGTDPAGPRSPVPDPAFRLVAFGICWFFLTQVVESSLIPIRDVIFEHRLYLPSFGIALAVVATLALALGRRPRLQIATAVLVVMSLGVATWQRNLVWQDGRSLWGDAAAKSPRKGRPHHNYAKALSAAGESEQAILEFRQALEVGSPTVETLVDLAAEYEKAGQAPLAERYLRRALAEDPRHVKALTRLAILILQREATPDEGMRLLLQAAELQPNNANVHFNLGVAFETQGNIPLATRHYERAIALDPAYAKAHNALGVVYLRTGRFDRALEQFQRAITADPGLADAYYNLALTFENQGRLDLAAKFLRQAKKTREDR